MVKIQGTFAMLCFMDDSSTMKIVIAISKGHVGKASCLSMCPAYQCIYIKTNYVDLGI
jgi:hypothetical protein